MAKTIGEWQNNLEKNKLPMTPARARKQGVLLIALGALVGLAQYGIFLWLGDIFYLLVVLSIALIGVGLYGVFLGKIPKGKTAAEIEKMTLGQGISASLGLPYIVMLIAIPFPLFTGVAVGAMIAGVQDANAPWAWALTVFFLLGTAATPFILKRVARHIVDPYKNIFRRLSVYGYVVALVCGTALAYFVAINAT